MDLSPGQLFGERFILDRNIGIGGFSEVWLVRDHRAGDTILALKIYAAERGLDETGLHLFTQEYQRVLGLRHPHILTPRFYDEWQRRPYLIMDYIERGSLGKRLIYEKTLPEPEIIKVVHQIGSALQYLHTHDIIHQDIKPDNVLIDEFGNYLLMDFGISRSKNTLRKSTLSNKSLTVAYSAPERFRGSVESMPAGDIFSMGVMIFEMATGDVPWMGLGGQALRADSEMPALPGSYSRGLNELMQRCLSYDPAGRPSAEELASFDPNSSYSPPNGRKTIKSEGKDEGLKTEKQGRKKSLVWLIVPALLALTGIGIALFFLLDQRNKPVASDTQMKKDTVTVIAPAATTHQTDSLTAAQKKYQEDIQNKKNQAEATLKAAEDKLKAATSLADQKAAEAEKKLAEANLKVQQQEMEAARIKGDAERKQREADQSKTPANEIQESYGIKGDGIYAVFSTSKGKIVCELEYSKAPMTVGNFVSLCEGKNPLTKMNQGKPFYDGLKFHRVIANFMIQGGDPLGTGMGDAGYKFPDEFDPSLRHSSPGILSMANAGPGTNGTQFFITHVATPWLNDKYTVFGHVVEGQDVVNEIAQGDIMNSVRIIRVGNAAQNFNAAIAFLSGIANMKAKEEQSNQKALTDWDTRVRAKYPNAKRTSSGLYYEIYQKGTGNMAQSGQTVVTHYTGTLFDDGKKFDSSIDRGQPFEFPIGQGKVIKGWEEGFMLLRVGSKAKLIMPADLAYGSRGAGGVIPPNAALVFDVEMLGLK